MITADNAYTKSMLVDKEFYAPERPAALICQFTRNQAYVDQYIAIREFLYSHGGKKYEGAFLRNGSDTFDSPDNPNSYILVAHYGKKCIGGARIIVREPRASWHFPGLENDVFSLEMVFPKLSVSQKKVGEFSRFVLLPEYTAFSKYLCDHVYNMGVSLHLDYLMWMGDLKRTIAYRRICTRYAATLTTHFEIEVPESFQSSPAAKKFLSILDFSTEYDRQGENVERARDSKVVA